MPSPWAAFQSAPARGSVGPTSAAAPRIAAAATGASAAAVRLDARTRTPRAAAIPFINLSVGAGVQTRPRSRDGRLRCGERELASAVAEALKILESEPVQQRQ